jgi:hypothetical protein
MANSTQRVYARLILNDLRQLLPDEISQQTIRRVPQKQQ